MATACYEMWRGLLGNTPSGTSNSNGLTEPQQLSMATLHGETDSVNTGQAELFKVQQHVRGVAVNPKSSCAL